MSLIDADLILDAPALRRERDRVIREHLGAIGEAVYVTTRHLELDLEGATRRAVPGNLWRAWTSAVGPGKGKVAREPAGWVRLNSFRERGGRLSRTYGAVEFFTQPGRIQSKDGFWLAIPLPAAGARGRQRMLTPGDWERRTGRKLRLVYRRGKPGLLVADDQVLSGKNQIARNNTAKRIEKGRGSTTVPIFVLVPYVKHDQRFAIEPYVQRAERELVGNARLYLGRLG